MKKMDLIAKKAREIKLFILDVDGVMTDGRLYFDHNGESLKVFHVHDGYGIKALISSGLDVSIISSRNSQMVSRRAAELGIHYVFQGQQNKLVAYHLLATKLGVADHQVACMGDDLPDAVLMEKVALSFAPADAHPSVLKIATVVTRSFSGRGAVREVCDFLIRARS